MPMDKSLYYYGAIYHRLFDPQLSEARQIVVDLIPEGSSVLDIACGTGLLCLLRNGFYAETPPICDDFSSGGNSASSSCGRIPP